MYRRLETFKILALRSKKVYGAYERKVVLEKGTTAVNGPHQGAWATTLTGEDWFLPFQDKEQYGRVVHLQPLRWVNDWPIMGEDKDGNGKGQPVLTYRKPNVRRTYLVQTPPETDEFNDASLGLQWQWPANPKATGSFVNPASGTLCLYSDILPVGAKNPWEASNVLLQKLPADEFIVTTKLTFKPNKPPKAAGRAVVKNSILIFRLPARRDGWFLRPVPRMSAQVIPLLILSLEPVCRSWPAVDAWNALAPGGGRDGFFPCLRFLFKIFSFPPQFYSRGAYQVSGYFRKVRRTGPINPDGNKGESAW